MASSDSQYRETVGDLLAYKNAALQALADSRRARQGETILYCTDFNVIHPYMWEELNTHANGPNYRTAFYDTVGQTVISLETIYRAQSEFDLVISDLTLLEILDSIYHRYIHFEGKISKSHKADELFSSVTRLLSDLDENIRTGGRDALSILRKITSALPNGSIRDASARITALIDSKTIKLLSNTIEPEVLREAIMIAQPEQSRIAERIRADRYEKERRSFDHSSLHYGADAWNLTLPKALNSISKDISTAFVCKPELRRYLDGDISRYGNTRSPLAPFLKLTALNIAGNRKNIFDESDDWLEEVHEQSKLRLDRLQKVNKLEDLTEASLLFIDKFYTDYVRRSISSKEEKEEMERERDRIAQVLKDKTSFLEHFDAASQDARKGGAAPCKCAPRDKKSGVIGRL